MKCNEIKALIHDCLDGLLSEPQQRKYSAHLNRCPACYNDYQEMKQVLVGLRTLRQPDAVPPPGFTAQVMGRLREEEKVVTERRFLRIPMRTLAMAASILLLFGINSIVLSSYRAGGLMGFNILTPATDSTPVPKPVAPDPDAVETPVEKPLNQGNEADAPAELPVDEPLEMPEDAAVASTIDDEGTEEGLPGDDYVAEVVPAEPEQDLTDASEARERPAVVTVKPLPKENIEAEVMVEDVRKPVKTRQVTVNELVLPNRDVFVNQTRITEGRTVKLTVQHLEKASQLLVSNASVKGLTPVSDYTILTHDGRLIRVYQYEVPADQVNKFVTETATLGRLIAEDRTTTDISNDYARKLAQYEQLVNQSMTASGVEAEQLNEKINELVNELSRMDKNARRTHNVIVWLES